MIDWSRGVDGERYIEVIKPIPTTSQGKRFELRRETVGAYDKGKAGLVLEEQTLLVEADSGEVYTKLVGSAFFVGQVIFVLSIFTIREDMEVQRVRKKSRIRLLKASHLVKLPDSRQVLVRLCYIDFLEITTLSTRTLSLDRRWDSKVSFQPNDFDTRRYFAWVVHVQYCCSSGPSRIREFRSCKL